MNKDLKDQPASPSKGYEMKVIASVGGKKAITPKESEVQIENKPPEKIPN